MKLNLCAVSALLFALVAFPACQEKELYVPEDGNKVTDLTVPSGFDWEMSRNVQLTVTSPVETSVAVYLSADCKEEAQLASLSVFNDSEPTRLSVPKGTDKLYVQYTREGGTQNVIPVSVASSATRTPDAQLEVKLPEDVKQITGGGRTIYYPSQGWGSLLFEDSWPVKGDYDFNDLAAWYQIISTADRQGGTTLTFAIRLTALGGLLPYELCLMLDNIKAEDVRFTDYNEEQSGGRTRMITSGSENAVFAFNWGSLKGSNGGHFYNTEKIYEIPELLQAKTQVVFEIYLSDYKVDITGSTFNFFIRNSADKNEVHLMGYKPTEAFASAYAEKVNSNSEVLDRSAYYRSADGFVWGLKIPKTIPHAREGVDFCQAYGHFANWVLSGGKEYQDWYNDGKEEKLISIR